MDRKPVTVIDIQKMKVAGEKISVLTAYDYPFARLMDQAGIDMILVGDSVGTVVSGYDNTLPVTMDEMVYHTRAVCRATTHALVVADLPFLSYQVDLREARGNAGRQRHRHALARSLDAQDHAPGAAVAPDAHRNGAPVDGNAEQSGIEGGAGHQRGGSS